MRSGLADTPPTTPSSARAAVLPSWINKDVDRDEEQRILDTAAARIEYLRLQPLKHDRGLPLNIRHVVEDACIVLLVLLAVFFFLLPSDIHAADTHADHAADHTPNHAAGTHGASSYAFDMQVSLVICSLLIAVTMLFERCKSMLEASVPRLMAGVLQALFGELTVLGFLSLTAFGLVQSGALAWESTLLYGDATHLLHLFETIHFLLFFVMLIFLVQALLLVGASLRFEHTCTRTEAMVTDKDATTGESFTPTAALLVGLAKQPGRLGDGSCLLVHWQRAEARAALQYALLRHRFIHNEGLSLPIQQHERALCDDFDFSAYLRRRCAQTVAEVLHVSEATWLAVLVFIALIIDAPLLINAAAASVSHREVQLFAYCRLLLGLAIWLLARVLQTKLRAVVDALTPTHPLLQWTVGDGSPTGRLLQRHSVPPVEKLAAQPGVSKHESLLWGGRAGPARLVFGMRMLTLLSAISFGCLLASHWSAPEHKLSLLLALLPVVHTMVASPRMLLPSMVLATSVEQLKRKELIKETLQEMAAEKALRLMRTLRSLESFARGWQRRGGQTARSRQSTARGLTARGGEGSSRVRSPPGQTKAVPPGLGAGSLPESPATAAAEDAAREAGFSVRFAKAWGGEEGGGPPGLSADAEAQLREAFDLYDSDGSGSIDRSELGACMATLGVSLSSRELAMLHAEMDGDHSGQVDFGEFCHVFASGQQAQTPREVADAVFAMLDKSGDGFVSASELHEALCRVGVGLTAEDILAAMRFFDEDGSGEIGRDEFARALETMRTFE